MPRILPSLALCLLSASLVAQEYSYDGNRWYEVEASIFTNDYVPSQYSEIAVAEKTRPAYLPRLQELFTRGSSFDVDFPEELPPPVLEQVISVFPPPEPVPEPVVMGPLYSPADPGAFHILDAERDGYIDLGTQAAQFTAMNRNLDASGEHRVLWHKVWRQPMQGRAQTQAVFVSGGEMQGSHAELEGNLRLSDGGGNVMLDVNVWLNRFRFDLAPADPPWQIPEYPFPPDKILAAENPLTAGNSLTATMPPALTAAGAVLSEVWQLEQTRELGANQLYYLDHPALGVLIQIRPYVLPPRLVPEEEVDF